MAIMDEIFKRAILVLVWLGARREPESTALCHRGIPLYPASPIRHHFTASPDWKKPDHRREILQILSRPYWDRLWIIQEFLLAREILLFYGDDHFWGQDLFRTLCELQNTTHHDTSARKLVYAKFSKETDKYRLFGQPQSSLKILKDLVLE